MKNLKKLSQVSEEFSEKKLPKQLAKLSIPPQEDGSAEAQALMIYEKSLGELVGKINLRKFIAALKEKGAGLGWLENINEEDLKMPAIVFAEHHQLKKYTDQNGVEHLVILFARSMEGNTEVFHIFDLHPQSFGFRTVDATDPLFAKMQEVHVDDREIRRARLNKYIEQHDKFFRESSAVGGIPAFCMMLHKAIQWGELRKTKIQAQAQAISDRVAKKSDMYTKAEDYATGAEPAEGANPGFGSAEDEFKNALSGRGFFDSAKSIIVHILGQYQARPYALVSSIESGQLRLDQVRDGLVRQGVDANHAQNVVDGMIEFIKLCAAEIQRKADAAKASADKREKEKKEREKQLTGIRPELPNIPGEIGQLTIDDMPKFVATRMHTYKSSRSFIKQEEEVGKSIESDADQIVAAVDVMKRIRDEWCSDESAFPRKINEINQNPQARAALESASDFLWTYYNRYASKMFIDDGDGRLRPDKRKIGSGRDEADLAALPLSIYIHHVIKKLHEILGRDNNPTPPGA